MSSKCKIKDVEIEWLTHDCFKIKGNGLVIYTDPYNLKGEFEPADIILVTHEHYDHCDPDSLELIKKEDTKIVTNQAGADKLGAGEVMSPGDSKTIKGVEIQAVRAYNQKENRKEYHPKENGGLGFVFKAGKTRIYHCGDTDVIPEMEAVKADVGLICVSGTYVMSPEEAAEAVREIGLKKAIPMHIEAGVVGTRSEAERFKKEVGDDSEVVILDPRLDKGQE